VIDLAAYLDARRAEIDAALDRLLADSAASCPPVIAEAMRYSVMAGGKRLRPVLTLASAEAVARAAGTDDDTARRRALPAACAVELIHTYSLVHDDLPAMDNDTLRRGRPTSHVVFGEGMAILAGDGLLTLAFEVMGSDPIFSKTVSAIESPHPLTVSEKMGADPVRQLNALWWIARAAGPAGMVGGQAIDLQAVGRANQLDVSELTGMHARKTGALITAAAASGAIMAGAPDDAVAAIAGYADELGLAFQIVDDILDVEGESAALGKTIGKDAAAGKPTFPALFGLEDSREMADACVERAIAELDEAALTGRLADIARWVVRRRN
jgi:geranylgeranyl diphosphate synthase type II